jgi:hypothetical protein
MKKLFNQLKPSNVFIKEIDTSIIQKDAQNHNIAIVVGLSEKVPINKPILIAPKIKPIKWYQIWRYKDKIKYAEEIKRCINEFHCIFGFPDAK